MTSRQGIEIPFIKVEELAEVKEALAKGGVGTGVCGPRVRTVTACQGSEVCPSGCIDTYTLAKELDERYFGRELPHKFKFGVTGCQNNCLWCVCESLQTGCTEDGGRQNRTGCAEM